MAYIHICTYVYRQNVFAHMHLDMHITINVYTYLHTRRPLAPRCCFPTGHGTEHPSARTAARVSPRRPPGCAPGLPACGAHP